MIDQKKSNKGPKAVNYKFKAENKAERDQWVKSIRTHIEKISK